MGLDRADDSQIEALFPIIQILEKQPVNLGMALDTALSPFCHQIVGFCIRQRRGANDMSENYFELWARSVGGKPEQFTAGQTIFSQGESGNRMYIVRSGSVEILVNGLPVETVEPNGIFGEMAVVDGGAAAPPRELKPHVNWLRSISAHSS